MCDNTAVFSLPCCDDADGWSVLSKTKLIYTVWSPLSHPVHPAVETNTYTHTHPLTELCYTFVLNSFEFSPVTVRAPERMFLISGVDTFLGRARVCVCLCVSE